MEGYTLTECTEKQLQQALKVYYEVHDKKDPIDMEVLDSVISKIKKDSK